MCGSSSESAWVPECPALEGAGARGGLVGLSADGWAGQQQQQREKSRVRTARVQRTNMMQLAPPWNVFPMPCQGGEKRRECQGLKHARKGAGKAAHPRPVSPPPRGGGRGGGARLPCPCRAGLRLSSGKV